MANNKHYGGGNKAGKRRGNNEGSIVRLKDGRWYGRVRVGYKPDGSPKMAHIYDMKRENVQDKIRDAIGKVKTNSYIEPSKITIGDWVTKWLTDYMNNAVKDSTYISYKNTADKHIIPTIGGIKLSKLTTGDLQRLYNSKLVSGRADGKEGGLSPRSVRYIHQVMHGALEQARKEKIIPHNVAEETRLPKNPKKEMQSLNVEDIVKFLDTAKKPRYKNYYPTYLLELYTGLRRGELLALRWQDVDFKRRNIHVVQQLVKVGTKHFIRELKTESSNRNISIPAEVVTVLKEHKKKREQQLKEFGKNDIEIKKHFKTALVFVSQTGGIIQPHNFLRSFKGVLKTAGIDDMPFHSMRHTFALMSRKSGVSLDVLQNDLGHTTIKTTIDQYGHIDNEMKQDASEKRSQLLKACIK